MLMKIVARTLVLAVVYAVALLAINASDTTDPLGPGLLLFLVFVLIGLVWGTVDGRRYGGRSVLVWLATAVVAGGLIVLESALLVDDVEIGASVFLSTIALVVVLVWLPALVGTGVGALLRRATTEPST